jgi:hypothetical protein
MGPGVRRGLPPHPVPLPQSGGEGTMGQMLCLQETRMPLCVPWEKPPQIPLTFHPGDAFHEDMAGRPGHDERGEKPRPPFMPDLGRASRADSSHAPFSRQVPPGSPFARGRTGDRAVRCCHDRGCPERDRGVRRGARGRSGRCSAFKRFPALRQSLLSTWTVRRCFRPLSRKACGRGTG